MSTGIQGVEQFVQMLDDDGLQRLQEGDVVVQELEARRQERERRRRQEEAQRRQKQVQQWLRTLDRDKLDQLADDPRSGLTESQRIDCWAAAEPAFNARLTKNEVVEVAGEERHRRRREQMQAATDGGIESSQVVAGVDRSTATLALLVAAAWLLFGG